MPPTIRIERMFAIENGPVMKVLAVLLSLAVASQALPAAPAVRSCQLQSDLQSLAAMMDTDAIAQVVWSYIDDPDMQRLFVFLFSAEFRDLYLAIADQPEVVQFALWLDEQCVDVRPYLNAIRDYLELPPVPWNQVQRNGIANFWEDLIAAIDLVGIRLEAERLYQDSLAFAEFVDKLRSPETEALFWQLSANPTYQYAVAQLEANGINVAAIREIIGAILGWA